MSPKKETAVGAGSSSNRSNTRVRASDRARRAAAEARAAAERRDRRRRLRLTAAVVAALALVGAAVLWGTLRSGAPAPTTPTVGSEAGGLGAEAPPPWPAPQDVPARAKAAALQLGPMGTAEHYHAHIDVLVNGDAVPVPVNIGVDPATGTMTGLHTHTPDGLVHIEASQAGQPFTLGQLFTEWNVRLTSTQIGGLKATADRTLTTYVNGSKITGNPAAVRLEPHQQIALVFGPDGQQVDVPGSYNFGPGQ